MDGRMMHGWTGTTYHFQGLMEGVFGADRAQHKRMPASFNFLLHWRMGALTHTHTHTHMHTHAWIWKLHGV